jgi:hypothetical protein
VVVEGERREVIPWNGRLIKDPKVLQNGVWHSNTRFVGERVHLE